MRLFVDGSTDGKTFHPNVDKRLEGLFTEWLMASQEMGYPLIGAAERNGAGGKQGGIGGFSCRAIKGSNPPVASNHSSGTAIDVYTRSNPQRWSERGPVRFASTIHPHMVELAAAADIYWGGWYWDTSKGRYVDAMHAEYAMRPENVAESLARLRAKADEIRKRLAPQQPEEPDVDAEQVKELQRTLNRLGAAPQLVVDGVFGPLTEAAMRKTPERVEAQIAEAESATEPVLAQIVALAKPFVKTED